MTVRRVLLVSIAAVLVFAPLTLSARRLTSERSRLRSAHTQLNTTAATAQRVIDLRGKRQKIADRKLTGVRTALDAAAHHGWSEFESLYSDVEALGNLADAQ